MLPGDARLHDVEIPQSHLDRIVRRRGRLHIYADFDPKRTALVVVDMQNAFVAPGGIGEVPLARAIVPNINAIARALRTGGGRVVWIRGLVDSPRGPWALYLAEFEKNPDAWRAALAPGAEGWKFWHEMDVRPDDLVVRKDRYSAFHGPDDLDGTLRAAGVDTVIVAGTLTNSCCESTARDAMHHDYRTIMVMDANACRSDADHLATMSTFLNSFGDVLTTAAIVARIAACRGAATRAAE